MCKKQTSVWHSSAEPEVISFDAGLRMDGKSGLDLWDLVIAVLHYSSNPARARSNLCRDTQSEKRSNVRAKKQSNTSEDLGWTNVDFVTLNAKHSRFGALLFNFEDNEAVIKMII